MIGKLILILLIPILSGILVFSTCGSQVFAQTRTPTPKASERLVKAQSSLDRITSQMEGITTRMEKILDNLQRKIVRTKSSGKDVTKLERLMKDSRERIIKVKGSIKELKTMREVSKTRADYIKVRAAVKLIKEDLQIVKRNIAEIISTLKGDNSSDSGFDRGASESSNSSR